MQYTPVQLDSIQQLHLWTALALQAADYPAQVMREGTDPVPPYFVSIAPLVSGANAGKTFARISSNIELNEGSLFGPTPLALAAISNEGTDTVPSHLYSGLTLAGGDGGKAPYALPVSGSELFLFGESVTQAGVFATQFEDKSGKSRHAVPGGPTEFSTGLVNGQIGIVPLYNEGSQAGVPLANGTGRFDTWTIFFTLAQKSGGSHSLTLIEDADGKYIDIFGSEMNLSFGSGVYETITIPAADGLPHLYIITFDRDGYSVYRDGALVGSESFLSAINTMQWTTMLTSYDDYFWLGDLVAFPSKLSVADLNAVSNEIADYRSMSITTIS